MSKIKEILKKTYLERRYTANLLELHLSWAICILAGMVAQHYFGS